MLRPMEPDPNSGSNQRRAEAGPMISASGIPIGGNVSVLDESSLPPLGTINVPSGTSLNIPVNLPGMPGGMSGGSSGSSGSRNAYSPWEEALAEAEALAVQECRPWVDQAEARGNRVKVAKECRQWEARKEAKARWVKAAKGCHHREALAAVASKE